MDGSIFSSGGVVVEDGSCADDAIATGSETAPVDETPTPSSAAVAARTEARYRRRARGRSQQAHKLWSHSKGPERGQDVRNKHRQRIFYCKHCTNFTPSPNLESVRRHLTKDHKLIIEEDEKKLEMQIKGSLQSFWGNKSIETDAVAGRHDLTAKLGELLDEEAIDLTLVTLIVRRNLPYTCVQ